LINSDELENAERDLSAWLERDRRRFLETQKNAEK
jgi:hypothetical protein